ncbi:MFP transporter, partial [Burkholderia pseudomallei]
QASVVSLAPHALTAPELAPTGGPAAQPARGTYNRSPGALNSQSVMAYGRAQRLQAGRGLQAVVLLERGGVSEWVGEALW